jgi:RHS repeat-associated protein
VLRVTVSRAPNIATAVALTSSNPSFASVPPEANIAAGALFADFPVLSNAVGQATITATLNGGSATASVTIAPAELVTLTLSPQTPTNYVGETVPFTATGTMTDGTTQDFTTRVTWTSSAASIATIASTGVARVLAAGQTTIGASFTFTAAQTGQPVTIAPTTVLTARHPVALMLTAPTTSLIIGNSTIVTVTSTDPAPAGGLAVALTGSGTGAGTFPTAVTIPVNGTQATFAFGATAEGNFTLTATAPNRLPGAITFAIAPPLVINSVAPASAEIGALITLAGTGFDPNASGNQLVFRGIDNTTVPATTVSATATQLTVKVPPLAESGPITLTNFRGTTQSPAFTVNREQNFQLVVSPAALTVYQGASGTAQAQLASTGTKPFTGLVSLSVTGLPSGVTAKFTPAANLSGFQTGAVTITASGAAVPGTYNAVVQATFTEGGMPFVRSSQVAVNVTASTNLTGVKGRFVSPDGSGVAGIIVRADIAATPQPQVTSDAAGNFQLTGLPAGDVTLRMDASPVNPTYPIWPATITLVANRIITLSDWYMIPPPSDDKFTPINNATQTQTITDPRYPGLAVTLPAGVTIRGWDGVLKTRIAVERFDPDQLGIPPPPIPTKSVYQLFFGTSMGGLPSAPIPVTHPNDLNLDPGEKSDLYYYDGSPMGSGTGVWRKAGTGTVSADGKTISSDPGSGIPKFCGRCGPSCFAANGGTTLGRGCPSGGCPDQSAGASVDLATGQEFKDEADLNITGLIPLTVARSYHPRDAFDNIAGVTGSLGFGWVLSYDVALIPLGSSVRIVFPGNSRANLTPDGAGGFVVANDTRLYGAVLKQVNANLWELTYKDGRLWRFTPNGPLFFLSEQRDTNGNSLVITRNASGHVQTVQGRQRSLAFSYGPNAFISTVTDGIGRSVGYTYNGQGRLSSVTAPDGGLTNYTYVNDSEFPATACAAIPGGERLKTIQRPGQTAVQTLFYGPGRRVLREVLEDGSENKFDYKLTGGCVTHISTPTVACTANCPDTDSWENFQAGWRFSGGTVVQTTFTDANGKSTTQRFNGTGLGTQVTDAQGQTIKYARDASNRVTAITDALGRTTKYQYDNKGNKTKETDSLGRITDYTYDPKWNKVATVTRYLPGNIPVTQQLSYDVQTGDLLTSTDPLSNVTTYTYTIQGQLKTVTAPGNRTTTWTYNDSGDLVAITDPLGKSTELLPDAVGRVAQTTDPLGFSTSNTYSSIDQLKQVNDAIGGVTTLNYDTKRNLSSVVNPLNVPIETYQYDNLYRLTQRTDPKLKSTTYQYDTAGNVSRVTDRKAQVTALTYDGQNRVVQITYPDTAQSRSYDAAGRLLEIREGASLVSYGYDDANRLVRAVTDNAAGRNEVGYEYDTLDRVIRRTVNGADATTYTYDNANRPLTIAYRGQTTSYAWDNASRLTGKTLPNGIQQEFTYDDADRVLSITYKKTDNSAIEQIAYTYDAKGQRLSKSSGASSVAETLITATYDAANRLVTLTLTASSKTFNLAYDDNGNLATKTDAANPANVTTYSWDSRNRLTGIAAPGLTASFAYDGLGRRASRTVNGQTVGFIYDGTQAIGEVAGGTISATILTTLAIDDVVARYSTAGTRTYLVDALGSVIAQAKDDQTIQNFYDYSAYGEATTLGPDDGNSLQYTNRENDGTGLYYYRARYYDPVLKRFVSEDPIGLRGGLNVAAYVRGNPISATDPSGQIDFAIPLIVIGGEALIDLAIAGIGLAAGALIANGLSDGSPTEARGGSDLVKGQKPFDPGRDCNGKCNKCPPPIYWDAPGDAHGSTGGSHWHGIVWNQDPQTCMCFPNRVSGSSPGNAR